MAKPDGIFIYIGTYTSESAARSDYEIVKDLHAVGAVGTYDAAVVTKDGSGKVHVNKDEGLGLETTQRTRSFLYGALAATMHSFVFLSLPVMMAAAVTESLAQGAIVSTRAIIYSVVALAAVAIGLETRHRRRSREAKV